MASRKVLDVMVSMVLDTVENAKSIFQMKDKGIAFAVELTCVSSPPINNSDKRGNWLPPLSHPYSRNMQYPLGRSYCARCERFTTSIDKDSLGRPRCSDCHTLVRQHPRSKYGKALFQRFKDGLH